MKIKQMNKQERPRERAYKEGIHKLSNRELIAIILRSGNKQYSALELSDTLLSEANGLLGLLNYDIHEFMKISGIKIAKATQLAACFELCKRIAAQRVQQQFDESRGLHQLPHWIIQLIGDRQQEHFLVLFLNNRNKIIKYESIFIGTHNQSFANPREIFMAALKFNASKIICAHNHPSGNANPSIADLQSAIAIEECGNIIGIQVIDHIIVSQNSYYSFYEHKKMLYQQQEFTDDIVI